MFNTVYGKTLSLDELRKIAAGLTKSAALRRIEEAEADDEEEDTAVHCLLFARHLSVYSYTAEYLCAELVRLLLKYAVLIGVSDECSLVIGYALS